jgi:hypothetical protein
MQLEIGKRISILEKNNVFSVVIYGQYEKWKTFALFLWLMAWTVCGFIFMTYLFTIQDKQARIYFIIFLSFWAYFEYKIAKALMWRRNGKEKLWIKEGIVHYQREVNGRGKVHTYQSDCVQNIQIEESKPWSWLESMNNSFWVIAGERLQFSHLGKMVRFGIQLENKDAKQLMNLLKSRINKG